MPVARFTPNSTTATIAILDRSLTEDAPEGITFEATVSGFDSTGPTGGNVYDNRLHDIEYFWDFGDDYNYASPVNLLTHQKEAGKQKGAKVFHVYRAAGTYTVTLFTYEKASGKTASDTFSVTVGDPAYSGSNIYFVDTTGVYTNAPVGSNTYTTLQAAYVAATSSDAATPKEIILENGQTHTDPTLGNPGLTANVPSILWRARDPNGTKPIVETGGGSTVELINTFGTPSDYDFKVQNIEFRGDFNTRTVDPEDGSLSYSGTQQDLFILQANRPRQFLLDGVKATGYNIMVYPQSGTILSGEPTVCIHDCHFEEYRSCMMFGQGNWRVTGNLLIQSPDALNWDGAVTQQYIGVARFDYANTAIVASNDSFSRTGWYDANAPTGIVDVIAPWRFNTGNVRGAYYNVSDNSVEGGFSCMSWEISGDPGTSNPINATCDGNIFVGYHDSKFLISSTFGGTTFRNNVCIFPNVAEYTHNAVTYCLFDYDTDSGTNAENEAAPMVLESNTLVCLKDTTIQPGGVINEYEADAAYTNVTVRNNIDHQPNRGQVAANLDTTVLWAPRYTHYEDNNTTLDATKATPAGTISLYRPNGSFVGAVTGNAPARDLLNSTRPGSPVIGATEPA